MNILIITGIYPPEVGGPAQYVKSLEGVWTGQNHNVTVKIFNRFKKYPKGIRHIFFFFSIIPAVVTADYIFTFDIFCSFAAIIVGKVFRKKVVLRIGGDQLWESYVNRSHDEVMLSDFYETRMEKLSFKEKFFFRLAKWTLRHLSAIIWSTPWQRDIFMKPYGLSEQKHCIVENFYPPALSVQDSVSSQKVFLSPSRDITLKNKKRLEKAFDTVKEAHPDIVLDTEVVSHDVLMKKISTAYVVVVASISEVSPNLTIEAMKYCVPIIVTEDVGIKDRLRDLAVFIEPLSVESIEKSMHTLLQPSIYESYKNKLSQRTFTHTYAQIAEEFLDIYKKI